MPGRGPQPWTLAGSKHLGTTPTGPVWLQRGLEEPPERRGVTSIFRNRRMLMPPEPPLARSGSGSPGGRVSCVPLSKSGFLGAWERTLRAFCPHVGVAR